MDDNQFGRIIYLLLLLAAVGGWVVVEYRQRMGQALRTAVAWGLIFVGLMAGYGLWTDLRRDILPFQSIEGNSVVVARGQDGHYHLTLTINGTPVDFIVDTGASTIVLSPADAARLGFDPAELAFVGEASTANGIVKTASVRLDDVQLGPFLDQGVRADVNGAQMDESLLGMSYLGRYSLELSQDRLILKK